MALTVEDGNGLADADSYITVAFADAYFTARGIAEWTGDNTAKEQAIIRATEYADLRWGSLLRGRPLTSAQALEFPRRGLRDAYGLVVTSVPENWKRAVCEYALQALNTDLSPAPANAPTVTSEKTVIGPITTETKFGNTDPLEYNTFPKADALAKQFIRHGGSSMVLRA